MESSLPSWTKIQADAQAAAAVIWERAPAIPKVGLVLGSGLGSFAESVEEAVSVPYEDLPGFPGTGVAGHAGRLLLGKVGGLPVAVMQGRAHYYEAANAAVMATPVRALAAAGCTSLILTNAAGSLREEAGPGSVMQLTDHINFTGASPLWGQEGNERFVDMSAAYDPDFQKIFQDAANSHDITLHRGVYMWFAGPNFETPAEIRAAKILGADAVGMSTVPEVILARQLGLKVAALSIITNYGAGMSPTKLSHEQTMHYAQKAAQSVKTLLTRSLSLIASQIES
ncbi:purine-nucleoside phosphorylase [Rhodovibrionaceae bacterium A322]